MEKKTNYSFQDIEKLVNRHEQNLPTGAFKEDIALVEEKLKISLPPVLKQWYLFTDGAILNNGAVSFIKVSDLVSKNETICGSWFKLGKDFFIAESDGYKYEADFYFVKIEKYKTVDHPVFAFNTDPTFTKQVSEFFYNFIKHIYNLPMIQNS